MNIRNARHAPGGMIDCEYDHPKFGWIPFTASPADVEPLGREIYTEAAKGDIAPLPEKPQTQIDFEAAQAKAIADATAAKADAKLSALADMSPSEVREWVNAQVKTLADAKDVLATLAVAVSVITKRL